MRTIKEWQEEVYHTASTHGWHNYERPIPERLCLIHSEVSEALEAWRKDDWNNFKEEIADIVIRVLDFCQERDINLDEEIEKKNEYNKSRPYLHGMKKG